MVKRTAESMEETGLRIAEMETCEETCKGSHVRDPCLGHQVATLAHLALSRAGRYFCDKPGWSIGRAGQQRMSV